MKMRYLRGRIDSPKRTDTKTVWVTAFLLSAGLLYLSSSLSKDGPHPAGPIAARKAATIECKPNIASSPVPSPLTGDHSLQADVDSVGAVRGEIKAELGASVPPPSWAVAYGREFWQAHTPPDRGAKAGPAKSRFLTGLNLNPNSIIDRVSHAFAADASAPQPRVIARSYQATFDIDGLRFTPAPPADIPAAPVASNPSPPDPTVKFRTLSICRDQQVLFSPAHPSPEQWVAGNTAQSLLDSQSGLVEHYEATAAGVAVTWILPHPIPGTGNLLIQAELQGLKPAGQTGAGLHFADATGTARVRIGPATVVDARGQRWSAAMQTINDRISVEVPAAALAQSVYPVAIDPLIAPEFGLDQPLPGVNTAALMAPSVTAYRDGFYVAWSWGKSETTDPAIYGARILLDGTLPDPYGIRIATIAGEQSTTAIAAGDTNLLVVWSAPHGTSTTDWDIYGARISFAGALLDANPIAVCTIAGVQTAPAVAANAGGFLVAWRDSRGTGGSIYGNLIADDGSVSTASGFAICTAPNEQYAPAVTAFGTNYLVVWQDYRKATSSQFYSDIYGARITGNGSLLDTNGIAICTKTNSQFNPVVAANGATCLVVWEDYDIDGNDLRGARINPDGVVLDTNSIPIGTAANLQTLPAVTPYGDGFLVVWQDYRHHPTNEFSADVFGARVTVAGMVLDLDGFALTTAPDSQGHPAVAAHGANSLVVWQDFRNNRGTVNSDIGGTRNSGAESPQENSDFIINTTANAELTPAIAFNGTDYLVVWSDDRNRLASGWDIYGARLSATGEIRDTTAIPLCTAPNNQGSPAVAANDSQFLVVWTDSRSSAANAGSSDIYGTRVSAGSVLDGNGLVICTAAYDQAAPSVHALGTNYLVVWQDARNSLTNAVRWDIYGARIDGQGTVLDPNGITISSAPNNQTAPAVAGNGATCLVAWTDNRNGTTSDIYGARLDLAGTVLETNGIPISTGPSSQTAPAVAANGSDYLVVWTDARANSTTGLDIYGARVNANGVVLDPAGFAVRAVPNHQSAPALSLNGGDYLVVWQEAPTTQTNEADIAGVAVNANGLVLTNTLAVLNSNPGGQMAPVIAGDSNGRCLIVNQGFAYATARTVANWTDFGWSNKAPARLHSSRLLSNGQFQFTVSGEPGPKFRLEATTDFTDWVSLEVLTATNGTLQYVDPASINLNRRFYRVSTIP